jgi:hypothetical protein
VHELANGSDERESGSAGPDHGDATDSCPARFGLDAGGGFGFAVVLCHVVGGHGGPFSLQVDEFNSL